MDSTTKARASYRFDDVLVDGDRLRVQKDDQPRKITPRAFDVLVYLIEHRDRIVEKQELFDEIWEEKFVTDNALTRIIKEIRREIGDDADAPRYIETVTKRGYRFIAAIERIEARSIREAQTPVSERPIVVQPESPPAGAVEQPASPEKSTVVKADSTFRRRWLVGAVVLGVAAVAALIIWRIQGAPDKPLTSGVLRNMQITTWPGLDAYPTLAPDGNSIAYSSNHEGSFEIYVRPLTPGAREIQITADGQQNFQPAWSPDGQLIAYYSKARRGIWVVPASGGTAKQLAEFGSRPAWSPDGLSLAFQSYGLTDVSATSVGAVSPSTLWVVPNSGGDPTPLTQVNNPPGGHGAPSWSPDGKSVVFIAYDGNLSTLCTVSLKENTVKRITESRSLFYDPIYAPDGEHIYFGGVSEPGNFVLYKLHVSGSSSAIGKPVEVADTGLMRIKNLTISADGKRIAYSAPMMKGSILSIPLARDSSEAAGVPVSLTPSTSYRKGLPRFSPDGRRIVYVDFRGGTNQDVWVMDADGQNP
ncbi:MAG: winged helix-turn-helix domain-containing protein, partial [Blastocatellia bacterium]